MTRLQDHAVVILYALIDQGNEKISAERLACLTSEERDRLKRLHKADDRARFLAGRALLRYGLRLLLDIKRSDMTIGPHGKPRLRDPARADIDFNLSHSGNVVACAFARAASVGIDIEAIDVSDGVVTAGCHSFAAEERAYLMQVPLNERAEKFFRLWTLKEAIVKATGIGLEIPIDSFVVALDPTRLVSGGGAVGNIADWHLDETVIGEVRFATAVRHPQPAIITVTYNHVALDLL